MTGDLTLQLFDDDPAVAVPDTSAPRRYRNSPFSMAAFADGRHACSSALAQLRIDLATADALGAEIPPAARATYHAIAEALAESDRYRAEDHRMLEGLRRLSAAEREAHAGYAWLAREACRRYVRRMTADEKKAFRKADVTR